MAVIGKDGKESKDGKDGKDGKDDAGKLAGLDALDIPVGPFDPRYLDLHRKFVPITLKPDPDLDPELINQTNQYWEAASAFGLVDSFVRQADGSTTLVLSVRDDQEAQELVAQDPAVVVSKITVSTPTPMRIRQARSDKT